MEKNYILVFNNFINEYSFTTKENFSKRILDASKIYRFNANEWDKYTICKALNVSLVDVQFLEVGNK